MIRGSKKNEESMPASRQNCAKSKPRAWMVTPSSIQREYGPGFNYLPAPIFDWQCLHIAVHVLS